MLLNNKFTYASDIRVSFPSKKIFCIVDLRGIADTNKNLFWIQTFWWSLISKIDLIGEHSFHISRRFYGKSIFLCRRLFVSFKCKLINKTLWNVKPDLINLICICFHATKWFISTKPNPLSVKISKQRPNFPHNFNASRSLSRFTCNMNLDKYLMKIQFYIKKKTEWKKLSEWSNSSIR